MDVQELVDGARDALSVRRVFGEPEVRDGVTVIPVSRVQLGGGAGGGPAQAGEGAGEQGVGGGFGLSARPLGVYVLTADGVRWQPAVDVGRMLVGMQVVAVVALLTVRAIVKERMRAQRACAGGAAVRRGARART